MNLGILAYGSLIDDPGNELKKMIVDRIPCVTPFNVEFGRISSTRDNAPTLIPVEKGGAAVNAVILVLNNDVNIDLAKSMLWRREIRSTDLARKYKEPKKPGPNTVVVKVLIEFHGVREVVYTSIASNIGNVHPNILAGHAVESILAEAGEDKKDGIRYLLKAKNNGIVTGVSAEYEAEILRQTNTRSLEEAIEQLDQLRPIHLERKLDLDEFELQVAELAELICNYGLKTTIQKTEFTGDDPRELAIKHRKVFMQCCHNGFKTAQSKIVALMLDLEDHQEQLEKELKSANVNKQRELVFRLRLKIKRVDFKEAVLRNLIDCIAWQLFKGQLYINRRLYQGVKGKKKLKNSNIESAINAAAKINSDPYDFALITDLSAFIQTADLIHIKESGEMLFVELKQGEKSRQILEVMNKLLDLNNSPEDVFKEVALDKHSLAQLDRNLAQYKQAAGVMEILSTDKGKDKQGRTVNIISPNEGTPRFTDQINGLEKQLEKRNFWAYDVVDDCLHLAMYKGIMRNGGPKMLEELAKKHNQQYIVCDYLSVLTSLHQPLFFLPVDKTLIFDILFGRVSFYMMLEIDKYLELFPEQGLKAEWMTTKETMKLNQAHKGSEMFTHKGRGLKVSREGAETVLTVGLGLVGKIFYEHILPAYTAYTFNYHLDNKLAHQATKSSDNGN
ncbi:hypothetical protein CPT03_03220 [Pedobacter ginsengisoli]|uniref:Uncharacterized protein n=1 Tax=Pedobacter ginsengisoli TaxID=363852 RepID=A0A2D1U1S5_9SPHI|nr:hypothetical protein [Pedobacter ginsengisoli]ATP55541.1 hypothetical protein CPT03_03220 [Pedobacter ginsengisoli]